MCTDSQVMLPVNSTYKAAGKSNQVRLGTRVNPSAQLLETPSIEMWQQYRLTA